jgi:branched-chain amino acid transport system ATP-binding protein
VSGLAIYGLARSFGGIAALAGVSLELAARGVSAIIGPNGAGKSTLAALICGRLAPDAGRIELDGRDITGLPAWRRARLGIAYTFQISSVFPSLPCRENVALAAQRATMTGIAGRLLDDRRTADAAADALGRVGLAAVAGQPAGSLAYGHRRLLEVAMALALAPRLLILDEPTQGLSEAEIDRFCGLARAIAREATVLLIEHNMDVVMALADRITVLDHGRVLAEGAPEAIRADPAVRDAYLGA